MEYRLKTSKLKKITVIYVYITTNCRTMPSTNSMNSLTSDTEDDSGPVYSTVKHGRR